MGRRTQGRPRAVGPSRVLLPGGPARQVAAVRQRAPRGGGRRPRSRDLLPARQLHLQEQALAQGPVQDAVRLRQRMVGARFYPQRSLFIIISSSASSSASLHHKNICTIKLSSVVTLGGAYNGGGASSLGQQGHVICCNGGCLAPTTHCNKSRELD